MKKIIISALIITFIIPSIALASWWNPFSWNFWKTMSWNNKPIIHTTTTATTTISTTTTTTVATTTIKNTAKNNIPTTKKVKEESITKISAQTETPQQYKETKTEVIVGAGVNTSGSNLTAGQIAETVQPVVIQSIVVIPVSEPVQTPIQEPTPVPTISMRLTGSYPSSVNLQNNATLWDSSATIENGPVILKNITLRMVGSIPLLCLQNFNLFVNGVKFGSAINELDTNGNVILNDSVTLNNGYHDIKLSGDILDNSGACSGRTFSFTLRSNESLTITDLSGLNIRLSNTELPLRASSQTIN